MAFTRTLPELIRKKGRWVLDGFVPGPAAFDWPKFAGKTGTLYVVEAAGFHKIGIATDFTTRFRAIDFATPLPVTKVATRTVPLAGLAFAEAWLHHRFADRRVKGEWFAVGWPEIKASLEKALVRARAYEWHSREWDREEVSQSRKNTMGFNGQTLAPETGQPIENATA